MRASGPAASTAAAQLERDAAEEEESPDAAGHWLSVLDEDMDATMESSKLPVLQALLERMERQAGRSVATELGALARGADACGEAAYGALDDAGRERLMQLARRFQGRQVGSGAQV